jgi:hypothetical protein
VSTFPPPLGVRIGVEISPHPCRPRRMHWTDSTGVLFVMAGRQGQILDEGEAVSGLGDVLIQNGTMHVHQTLEGPVVLGLVTLGALRTAVSPPLAGAAPRQRRGAPYRGGFGRGDPREAGAGRMGRAGAPAARAAGAGGIDRIEDLVAPRRLVTETDATERSSFVRSRRSRRPSATDR